MYDTNPNSLDDVKYLIDKATGLNDDGPRLKILKLADVMIKNIIIVEEYNLITKKQQVVRYGNVVSPNGTIHRVEVGDEYGVIVMCHQHTNREHGNIEVKWEKSYETVSCKNCLKALGRKEDKFQVLIKGGGYVVGMLRVPTRQPKLSKVKAYSVFENVDDAKFWIEAYNRRNDEY
jgi:hypothetical protein